MRNGIRARSRLSAIDVLSFIVVGLAACAREADERAEAPKRKPQQAGQPLDLVRTAGHIAGARVAAVTGNPKAAEAHVRAIGDDLRCNARMPDVFNRIDPESARVAVRPLPGVKSVVWTDRENIIVMVDGQRYRTMEMIDAVCLALEPLRDTLAVVVNLQDATAKSGKEAMTLSRNCQLTEGKRALPPKKRQVDGVNR